MSIFHVNIPTEVSFGEGCRFSLNTILRESDPKQILFIGTKSGFQRSLVKDLLADAEQYCPIHIWEQVRPNPRISDIEACLASFKDKLITHIIGVGGGSVLDQAKATAMSLEVGLSPQVLIETKRLLPKRKNKLILLPTVSGSGAELSYGAILTDEQSGEKVGLRGKNIAPDYALVDPEMTYSVPLALSYISGFDIFTHALETYLSQKASPFTASNSQAAMIRVFSFLPVLKHNLEDREARRNLAYASMLMGINLALSSTCMPHRLQYPVGAATDTAHALGLAALYPAWLRHVFPQATIKLAKCAEWIGVHRNDISDSENAASFVKRVLLLMKEINLNVTLKDLNLSEQDIGALSDKVSGMLETDPSYKSRIDIMKIYTDALKLSCSEPIEELL
ncbi:iron-containing alcohol dehydrogenase [Oxalobacter sp. OttesenSCG-928-P03]|nr:iron-containing alcohol dehydrogenase [Oxalobacter sp. OttesenSCG-928-P03]